MRTPYSGLGNWMNNLQVHRCLAVSGTAVYAAANSLLSGGLAPVGRGLGLAETDVGAILSLGAFAGVIMAPLWGVLAEREGRRKMLIAAMPFVAAGPLLMAAILANSSLFSISALLAGLMIARLAQAGFGAALLPVAQAYVADTTEAQFRVSGMGLVTMSVSLGTVIGSVLLWSSASLGMSAGLAMVGSVGAVTLSAVLFLVPEPVRRPVTASVAANIPFAVVWPYLAITLLGFTSYAMIVPLIGIRMMDGGGYDQTSAIALAGYGLTGLSVAAFLSQALVSSRRRWNVALLLRGGLTGGLIAILLLALARTGTQTVIAMIAVGGALGLAAPAILGSISLHSGTGVQSKVAGVNAAVRGLGIAVGPVLGTALYAANTTAPFAVAFGLIGAATLLGFLARPVPRNR